jgi:hypothetical protein
MDDRSDDQSLFERIWYADRDARLLIGVDLRLYNRPGSPTYSQKDNGLPVVATLCCVASAWILGGWVWALAILASGVILTLTTVNVWILHRLRQRTLDVALSGLDGWQQAWDFGGITLRLAPDGKQPAAGLEFNSPGDDWRTFARRHLQDRRPN